MREIDRRPFRGSKCRALRCLEALDSRVRRWVVCKLQAQRFPASSCALAEIADPRNDFNLNLPRYIDSSEPENLQDIDGHLRGGIPECDLDAFAADWQGAQQGQQARLARGPRLPAGQAPLQVRPDPQALARSPPLRPGADRHRCHAGRRCGGSWRRRCGRRGSVAILSEHWPQWREARQELNELPLAAELWGR